VCDRAFVRKERMEKAPPGASEDSVLNPPHLMHKLRSDSTWAVLTPAQKEKLIQWLFDENLSYRETLERVQQEFGVTASKSSLAKYYQFLARERLREELCDAQSIATEAMGSEAKLADLRGAALKMVGKKLIDCALQRGVAKELPSLTHLLLLSEQQELQREWLALARERFQFKAAKAVLKVLPLQDELAAEEEAREIERVEKIKRQIFGKYLDGVVDPMLKSPCSSLIQPVPASSSLLEGEEGGFKISKKP